MKAVVHCMRWRDWASSWLLLLRLTRLRLRWNLRLHDGSASKSIAAALAGEVDGAANPGTAVTVLADALLVDAVTSDWLSARLIDLGKHLECWAWSAFSLVRRRHKGSWTIIGSTQRLPTFTLTFEAKQLESGRVLRSTVRRPLSHSLGPCAPALPHGSPLL